MFITTLARIVSQIQGAQGAAVINTDGLVIEAVDGGGRPVGPDGAAGEYASVISQLLGVSEGMGLGALSEFTVESERCTTVVRMLSPRYYVALQMPPEGVPGRGRFQLRVAAPDLAREL